MKCSNGEGLEITDCKLLYFRNFVQNSTYKKHDSSPRKNVKSMKSIKIVAFCGTIFVKQMHCMKTPLKCNTEESLYCVTFKCHVHAMHQSYKNGTTKNFETC